MSEKQSNEPMSFSSFADWCRHIDSLSQQARHTIKVLLEKAGTDDAQAAEHILSSMTELALYHNNHITDISILGSLTNLTTLHLCGNEITDISILGSLTNLTTLSLSSNQITDINFLGSLTNLTTLDLSFNLITDISILGSLTNLTTLNLNNNLITDISFLGSLTNLTTLDIGVNEITDISFLGSLTNLTTLNLYNNQITDISFLASLTHLTTLHLPGNQITDFSFLGSLTNLTTLSLSSNQITECSFFGSLINLTTLYLRSKRITDISFLGSLTNLTTLALRCNQITDISALRSLTNLTTLDLGGNQLTALCVLGEHAQKHLTLSTTPIDAQKAIEAVKVAYAAIDLEEPEVIICSSPRDAYLKIFNLPKGDYSQNCSDEWHRNRLGKKLDWQWMSASIVREVANPLVWENEFDRLTIESEADSALTSLINELIDEYELSERRKVNAYPEHLFSRKSHETPTSLCIKIYLTELYISSLGVNISQKAQEILRCQKLLFEHCGWIFPFEKICFVCDRPRHLRFDSQNRLHAEGEPAIEFADGWNFYYNHGVRLPEKYGKSYPN
jgi:Leucine-rich repeat (LRR) protein